jgi:hypothetical protein
MSVVLFVSNELKNGSSLTFLISFFFPTILNQQSTINPLFHLQTKNKKRMSGALLTLGLVSFIRAIFATIMTGVGWTVLKGNDVCQANMYSFVQGVTITATVELALYGTGMIIALLSICLESMEAVAVFFNIFVLALITVAASLIHLAWFIWGIIVLADQQCKGTSYNTFTIVLVVLSGLAVLNGVFSCRNNGKQEKK